MKVDEIKTIVQLMSENDLTEFKIESEGYNLCIKRGAAAPAVAPVAVAAAPAAVVAPAPVAAAPAPVAAVPAAPAPEKVIESPLVGTFYRSASPESAPFVQIGSKVDADTVVCIIEAMKVMNEIKAEKSGTIKDILVENGNPVEFGMPLFVIE